MHAFVNILHERMKVNTPLAGSVYRFIEDVHEARLPATDRTPDVQPLKGNLSCRAPELIKPSFGLGIVLKRVTHLIEAFNHMTLGCIVSQLALFNQASVGLNEHGGHLAQANGPTFNMS
jgi:hypothetical protein